MPPFRVSFPVRFDDIDHAGIVYYPRFFHFFHLAFEEFFSERMGAASYVHLLDHDRIGFPAVSAECTYKAPLRFGETMDIDMSVARLGERSLVLRYLIHRRSSDPADAGEGAEPVLAAEGTNTCAVVDLRTFRAVPLPPHLRSLFAAIQE